MRSNYFVNVYGSFYFALPLDQYRPHLSVCLSLHLEFTSAHSLYSNTDMSKLPLTHSKQPTDV